MHFDTIRARVLDANLALVREGLVILTWGNVSAIDREAGIVAIKPSGVGYAQMKKEDIVIVDLEGNVLDGGYAPSSDTPTHLHLYKAFPEIGAVVHTHSTYATAWAQAGRDIPAFGTTHADVFYGAIPVTPDMTADEVGGEYEKETGRVIERELRARGKGAIEMPAVLVRSHGPFAWGKTPEEAVENAVTLEAVAKMAMLTDRLSDGAAAPSYLVDKHYFRKHGENAYYGQKSK